MVRRHDGSTRSSRPTSPSRCSRCSAFPTSASTTPTCGRRARPSPRAPRASTRSPTISPGKMKKTGVKLLWGTANLFSQPPLHGRRRHQSRPGRVRLRRRDGEDVHGRHQAARSGENYVLWGGREGYETLLNTDIEARAATRPAASCQHGRRLQAQDRLQGHDPDRAEAAGADQAPVRLRRRHRLRLPQGATAWRRRSRSTSSRATRSSPATPSSTSWRSPTRSASSARST